MELYHVVERVSMLSASNAESSANSLPAPPPLPVLPIPSARQLKWQFRERSMFLHFGMNTFTNATGQEPPSVFHPGPQFSPKQWVAVAKAAGFKLLVLTIKHHDGFCLWPSKYTDYSVKSSTWKNGTGDVLKELVEAAAEAEIEVGVYLSPWDRHEPSYGDTIKYNEYYLGQMRELLTSYGTISEVWLDGNKGDNRSMEYKFDEWFDVVHQLQPGANIFSDAGPDVRWVGNEAGSAGKTCWSMVNRSRIEIGNSGPILRYLNEGDEHGTDWVAPECDVSIRTSWFWRKSEKPKNLSTLLDLYYESIGRNCVLLLNVPPNTSGLIENEDANILLSFHNAIASIFSLNLASSPATINASSILAPAYCPSKVLSSDDDVDVPHFWSPSVKDRLPWIELNLGKDVVFNVIRIQEAIPFGQRVSSHRVEAWRNGKWSTIANGSTIGYKRLHWLATPRKARVVRLVILASRTWPPLLASLGLHFDPYPHKVQV